MDTRRDTALEADETYDLIAADKVEGTPVYNRQGEKLGTIENVMIDKRSGRVAYAVMSFGGFLGIGDRRHALPWSLLTYDVGEGGYLVDIDRDRLETAPSFTPSQLPNWQDRSWGKAVHDYYGVRPELAVGLSTLGAGACPPQGFLGKIDGSSSARGRRSLELGIDPTSEPSRRMAKQLLHLVFGGELKDPAGVEFVDTSKLDIVGIYPNYAEAYKAWRGKAAATVDNASIRYFVVHMHRLLDPATTSPADDKH